MYDPTVVVCGQSALDTTFMLVMCYQESVSLEYAVKPSLGCRTIVTMASFHGRFKNHLLKTSPVGTNFNLIGELQSIV